MRSSSTATISKMILGDDEELFSAIQVTGFQVQDILNLISSWPRVPSKYKLQVIADALLSHYKQNPDFADNLSGLLKVLKESDKNAASYSLWKIINSWLHEQWTSLPCAELPSHDAYRLFPEHALPAPSIPLPSKPFMTEVSGFKYRQKLLSRPLDWDGALDSFSLLLDVIPQPKRISVIGFGDGKELIALRKKWPNTKIQGFEQPRQYDKYKDQLERIAEEPNITIYYDENPLSYKHGAESIDFVLIRHPDSMGNYSWPYIVLKAMDSLSNDGTLLISFYSKKEVRALKDAFMKYAGPNYIWSEKVNPYTYNPSFMSKSGAYSFDLFLVTIRSKMSNQADLLDKLTVGKTRKHEESNFEVKPLLKKFIVVEHENVRIATSPGFYEEHYQKTENAEDQCCFKCRKSSNDYFNAETHIGGKRPVYADVKFCAEHMPATKDAWEKMLKEPWSGWSSTQPHVYKFSLVGRGIPKLIPKDEENSETQSFTMNKM